MFIKKIKLNFNKNEEMFGVEQFEQLDSQKSGKLPLKTLRAHFKLDLSEEGDDKRLIDFDKFYNMVVNSVKVY